MVKLLMMQLMTAILALMMGAMGLGHAMADLGDTTLAITVADRIFRDIDEGKNSDIDGLSTVGSILTTKDSAPSIGKCLKFENVNFHYPTRREIEVCQNFSLAIEPGETVALVGPSGCGKSTIVNLLLRFYNVDSGSITMDGTNINELNVPWLRSQIGYDYLHIYYFIHLIFTYFAPDMLGKSQYYFLELFVITFFVGNHQLPVLFHWRMLYVLRQKNIIFLVHFAHRCADMLHCLHLMSPCLKLWMFQPLVLRGRMTLKWPL
jgi:hypothetical protein